MRIADLVELVLGHGCCNQSARAARSGETRADFERIERTLRPIK